MLSKSIGSTSTWSAAVAPCRSTITNPPARSACATAPSSATAGFAAAATSSRHKPHSSSSAISDRREGPGITASHQEHALAGGLAVEQLVGLVGLVEPPSVGEQLLDVDAAVGDELRAFGLAHLREGPRRDDRQLLPQHVGADVDRHLVALADKAGRAPHLGRAHRADAALGLA